VGLAVSQVARFILLLLNQQTAAGRQPHQPADELVQQRLKRVIAGRGHLDEDRLAVGVPVHAVEHQAVQVDVQIGRRPRHWQARLDQPERAAVGLLGLQPGLIDQEVRDGAVHGLQHGRHQLARRGRQQPQRNPQRQYAMARRHLRDHRVDQVGCGLRRAPCGAHRKRGRTHGVRS